MLLFLAVIIACTILYSQYQLWRKPNLHIPETSDTSSSGKDSKAAQTYLNITPKDSFDDIVARLTPYLVSVDHFRKAAAKADFHENIHTGHYVLTEGMNNREMIQMLQQGLQKPVRICFSVVRSPEKLAGILSRQIMLDSATIITTFHSSERIKALGFTDQTLPAFFLPDTYEVWWNCTPDQLIHTFERAYTHYWNDERKALVNANGLTPVQAATLASIVQDESNRRDEWPVIAGLYLNRLRKRIPLQACPTIKFAMNDFTIRRVLKEYTKIDSPYNTYKHLGLPPGPIGIPTKQALEAVVHTKPNNYLYMCAKDDFSGGHYFSTSLSQHNAYAARYHKALSKRRIWH